MDLLATALRADTVANSPSSAVDVRGRQSATWARSRTRPTSAYVSRRAGISGKGPSFWRKRSWWGLPEFASALVTAPLIDLGPGLHTLRSRCAHDPSVPPARRDAARHEALGRSSWTGGSGPSQVEEVALRTLDWSGPAVSAPNVVPARGQPGGIPDSDRGLPRRRLVPATDLDGHADERLQVVDHPQQSLLPDLG